MSVSTLWIDEEQTMIRFLYSSPINWEEYEAAADRAKLMSIVKPYEVFHIHTPGKLAMPAGNPIPHVRYCKTSAPVGQKVG